MYVLSSTFTFIEVAVVQTAEISGYWDAADCAAAEAVVGRMTVMNLTGSFEVLDWDMPQQSRAVFCPILEEVHELPVVALQSAEASRPLKTNVLNSILLPSVNVVAAENDSVSREQLIMLPPSSSGGQKCQ